MRRIAALLFIPFAFFAAASVAAPGEPRPNAIFLVASRGLEDPNFRQSVVLVTQHGGGGPVGIIINRPTPVPLKALFPGNARLAGSDEPVYFGGPVSQRMLVFVFRAEERPQNAVEVLDDLYMSFDPSLLRDLLARDEPVRDLRVFTGYAGWARGQLEHEIARGDWHLLKADGDAIFDRTPQRLWPELRARASGRQVRNDGTPRRNLALAEQTDTGAAGFSR